MDCLRCNRSACPAGWTSAGSARTPCDPVSGTPHDGFVGRIGPLSPIDAGRHVEHILNRHRFLGVIQIRNRLVGKQIDDSMVDAVQKTLLHLDGRERAGEALGHESQIVPNVGAVRRVIGVDDDLSMTDDQQAVLPAATDKIHKPGEGGRVHPLLFGR